MLILLGLILLLPLFNPFSSLQFSDESYDYGINDTVPPFSAEEYSNSKEEYATDQLQDNKDPHPVLMSLARANILPTIGAGQLTQTAFFKEVVAILMKEEFICAGVLVNLKFVLTAKICVYLNPDRYIVVGGENHLTCHEGGEQFRRGLRIHLPSNRDKVGEEIAILEVDEPFDIGTDVVDVAKLPEETDPLPDQAIAVGWGTTGESDPLSNGPRMINLTRNSQAQRCLDMRVSQAYENLECYTSTYQNQTSCYHDEGDPLFSMDGESRTLRGVLVETGCGIGGDHNISMIYNINPHLQWIVQISGRDAPEDPHPTKISTCSGAAVLSCMEHIEASSVRITVTEILFGHTCYYALKMKFDKVRIKLTASSLLKDDRIYVSGFCNNCTIQHVDSEELGKNYTIKQTNLIYVQFHAYDKAQRFRNFTLEIYSSGFPPLHGTQGFTRVLLWNAPLPNTNQYPPVGEPTYRNNEDVIIFFDPNFYHGRDKLLMNFTFKDIKSDENCHYRDKLEIYYENIYSFVFEPFHELLRVECGSGKLPPPFKFKGLRGFFRFRSDMFGTGKGFGMSLTI